MAIEEKRLFVGGLFHGVTEQQVRERFDKFGQVNSVNVRVKKDETGQPVKTFAYVDITATEKSLKQCMQVYNKSKWKGSELQLQLAKESFLDRLKKEQTETKETEASAQEPKVVAEEPSIAVTMVPKKAVPGTLVGEEKTWVVGKYGRVLPIVNIRRKDKKRVILFDPSKCCHQVKKLDTSTKNDEPEKPVNNLTWQLDAGNIKKMKLRTGQVAWKKPVKETKTKMSPTEPVTEPSPKKPKIVVDLNQFEIVKSNSTYNAHRQSDDESYNSADTEEMITQMKSSSWKKSGKNGSHLDEGSKEGICKSTPNSASVDLTTKTNLSVLNHPDISAISVISTPVNGSVEKPKSLSVRGRLNPLKALKHAAMKTSTPKGVIAKRVYDSDSESDSSLERFPPKKKQKSKTPKDVGCDDGNSSPDTDDIISDSRRKVCTTRNAGTTATSETSLYVTADDDLRPLPGGSELCEDDDDDIFDLIESGRIDQLYKSAESSRNFGAKGKRFKEQNSRLGVEHTSKSDDATLETSVNESMKHEADLSSSKKIKPKKNKVNKTLTEQVATTVVTPAKAKKTEKAKSAQKMQTESTSVASSVVTPADAKSQKAKKAASAQKMPIESTSLATSKVTPADAKANKPLKSSSAQKMLTERISEPTSKVTPADAKKTEKAAFAQKFDKRKLSNEQRMSSVNERLKEARSQRFLIKKALSDVDKTSSAKIIFDSSDEEDLRVSATAKETSVSGNAGTTRDSSDESSSSDDDTHKQDDKTKRKKGVLFDSDDGSGESEAEDQRMFELRPEFEGKAGSELMKLQARFRNDQRFKLDKRFLESDSDADDQDEASDHAPDLAEVDDERARSLAILKEVVGEKAIQHINQRSKKKATFKDVATLHYDPSREDHKHFELEKPTTIDEGEDEVGKEKKGKKKKKKDDAKLSKPAVEPVEKVPGKFFEVSGSLKDLLKPAEKKPFSLLSMFGGPEPDQVDKNQKLNSKAVAEKLPVGHMQWQPQFGSDDSDDDAEGASLSVREDTQDVEPVKSHVKAGGPKTFFFVDNDCRIAEGIKSFCRPEDWEAVREKWLERRPDLVEDYRMKRKRAIRKAQSQRGKFGKTQRGGRR